MRIHYLEVKLNGEDLVYDTTKVWDKELIMVYCKGEWHFFREKGFNEAYASEVEGEPNEKEKKL